MGRLLRATVVCNFFSHLATWLRTIRFSEPTLAPSRPTNHWKSIAFRDFANISHRCFFFLLTLSLSLIILPEVWLLDFLWYLSIHAVYVNMKMFHVWGMNSLYKPEYAFIQRKLSLVEQLPRLDSRCSRNGAILRPWNVHMWTSGQVGAPPATGTSVCWGPTRHVTKESLRLTTSATSGLTGCFQLERRRRWHLKSKPRMMHTWLGLTEHLVFFLRSPGIPRICDVFLLFVGALLGVCKTQVGLFSHLKSTRKDMYEIVIGGWGNGMSVIRQCNQCRNEVSKRTPNINNRAGHLLCFQCGHKILCRILCSSFDWRDTSTQNFSVYLSYFPVRAWGDCVSSRNIQAFRWQFLCSSALVGSMQASPTAQEESFGQLATMMAQFDGVQVQRLASLWCRSSKVNTDASSWTWWLAGDLPAPGTSAC